MTTVTDWPGTLQVSPDEAAAVLESAPSRLVTAEDRIAVALHALTGWEGDAWPMVRILAVPSLSDDDVALWWETYQTAVRACDAIALGGDDGWRQFYDADDLTGGPGLSNAEAAEQMAAEQMAAQDADEELTVLLGGAR
jgi:hypothetical protein